MWHQIPMPAKSLHMHQFHMWEVSSLNRTVEKIHRHFGKSTLYVKCYEYCINSYHHSSGSCSEGEGDRGVYNWGPVWDCEKTTHLQILDSRMRWLNSLSPQNILPSRSSSQESNWTCQQLRHCEHSFMFCKPTSMQCKQRYDDFMMPNHKRPHQLRLKRCLKQVSATYMYDWHRR